MRLFVAADLPPDLYERLGTILTGLRQAPLPVRWVRPEAIHLTLKFLGEVGPERIQVITGVLGDVVRHIPPFTLRGGGLGSFPGRGSPRILWIGLQGDLETVQRLACGIEEGLERVGFARETRAFAPHLTLGRVKGPARGDWRGFLGRGSEIELGTFAVREVVLYESQLRPEGAIYSALARVALAEGASA